MRTYFVTGSNVSWGVGAHTTAYHSPEKPLEGPHPGVIQSAVHPSGNWSQLAPSTPLGDLCVSALADSCLSPALLTFTLMFNPILTVSSFSQWSRSASHEYPKVRLLDRIIPLFKATGDDSSATKKHTQWIFCSFALFLWLSFTLTPFCLCPSGLLLKHIDPTDQGVHLLLFTDY